MVEINGSTGEGGGQIIRTSLALAVLTKKKVTITNIRAKRKNPGIRPQHKSTIEALAKLSNASVLGNRIGSKSITFAPKTVRGGPIT